MGPPVLITINEVGDDAQRIGMPERLLSDHPLAVIIRETGRYLKISPVEILGDCRRVRLVRARHIAWYLAHHLQDMTLHDIAIRVRRHHTSILHGCRRVNQRRLAGDMQIAFDLREIWQAVNGARYKDRAVEPGLREGDRADAPAGSPLDADARCVG